MIVRKSVERELLFDPKLARFLLMFCLLNCPVDFGQRIFGLIGTGGSAGYSSNGTTVQLIHKRRQRKRPFPPEEKRERKHCAGSVPHDRGHHDGQERAGHHRALRQTQYLLP